MPDPRPTTRTVPRYVPSQVVVELATGAGDDQTGGGVQLASARNAVTVTEPRPRIVIMILYRWAVCRFSGDDGEGQASIRRFLAP